MRGVITILGVLILLVGVSGFLDHLAAQPVLGTVLNALNREVFEPHAPASAALLNIGVATIGAAVIAGSRRLGDRPESH